ncbi:MAG: amidohydrolase family protein [Pseudomonadales bacterium]
MPPPNECASPLPFVDAHHHLWDLSACHYPWLMARGVQRFFGDPAPIQKNYLVADLLSESSVWVPEKSVHIQVGVDAADNINESRWLQTIADAPENRGFPHAIVAFCDLSAVDAAAQLEAQKHFPNIRGIRHIVGRHIDEDKLTGSNQLLTNPLWKENLARLSKLGLSFDLQLIPQQLEDLYLILKDIPRLKVALCHCGSPWDQTAAGIKHWCAGLRRLAQLPNLYCKISGLSMFNHDWTTEEIRPLILSCIEIFGQDRCMFGSNFPVDKLHTSYQCIWDAYNVTTADFSHGERTKLFKENAEQFYRM